MTKIVFIAESIARGPRLRGSPFVALIFRGRAAPRGNWGVPPREEGIFNDRRVSRGHYRPCELGMARSRGARPACNESAAAVKGLFHFSARLRVFSRTPMRVGAPVYVAQPSGKKFVVSSDADWQVPLMESNNPFGRGAKEIRCAPKCRGFFP